MIQVQALPGWAVVIWALNNGALDSSQAVKSRKANEGLHLCPPLQRHLPSGPRPPASSHWLPALHLHPGRLSLSLSPFSPPSKQSEIPVQEQWRVCLRPLGLSIASNSSGPDRRGGSGPDRCRFLKFHVSS